MTAPAPILLTPKQAAEALVVSTRTLRSWEKRGILVPLRPGGIVRYDIADIRAMIERAKKETGNG